MISKIGLTLLAGIIVSLASVSLTTHIGSAQIIRYDLPFHPSEQIEIISVYGWQDGGNTVEVNVTNTGMTTVTITGTSINDVNCTNFIGSNGLMLYPGNSTVLTITYQDHVFQMGNLYEIKVMTANGNVYPYESTVPDVPEFPSSLLLPLSIIATLLAITIHRRKRSSFPAR